MLGIMPVVHQLTNSKIYVHARGEHPPPHFHQLGPGWEVSIDIHSLGIRRGSGPRADLAEAIKWASENRDYLLGKWSEYNERDI